MSRIANLYAPTLAKDKFLKDYGEYIGRALFEFDIDVVKRTVKVKLLKKVKKRKGVYSVFVDAGRDEHFMALIDKPLLEQFRLATENRANRKLKRCARSLFINARDWEDGFWYSEITKINALHPAIQGFVKFQKYFNNKNAVSISASYVAPVLRGQGVSVKMYDFMIREYGIVVSDSTQTKAGRMIWTSLIRHGKYKVFAFPDKRMKDLAEVYVDTEGDIDFESVGVVKRSVFNKPDAEIWSQVDLYNIRLMAIKPKKSVKKGK